MVGLVLSDERGPCARRRIVGAGRRSTGAERIPGIVVGFRRGSIPPPLPWKALGEPQADRDYLALFTFLPLRRLSKLPRFLGYVRKIQRQLDARPDGLIGYSLLARPLRSKYWTLSVWDDAAALGRFIEQSPPPRRDAGATPSTDRLSHHALDPAGKRRAATLERCARPRRGSIAQLAR